MSTPKNSIGIFSRKKDQPPPEADKAVPKMRKSVVVKDLREDPFEDVVDSKQKPVRPPTFADSPASRNQPFVSLEKEIADFNAAQDALLKEYYNKRHILIDAMKKPERQSLIEGVAKLEQLSPTFPSPQQQQKSPPAQPPKQNERTRPEKKSSAVISIFTKNTPSRIEPSQLSAPNTPSENTIAPNMSFRTKTEESYGNPPSVATPKNNRQDLPLHPLVIPSLPLSQSPSISKMQQSGMYASFRGPLTNQPQYQPNQPYPTITVQPHQPVYYTQQAVYQPAAVRQLQQQLHRTSNNRTSIQVPHPYYGYGSGQIMQYGQNQYYPEQGYEQKDEEDQQDESTNESFYTAYLRIQQEKLQKQKEQLSRISQRLRQDQQSDRIIAGNFSMGTLHRSEPEQLDFGGDQNILEIHSKADTEDWEVPEVRFAFLLAEAISLEEHRNILKGKLRYKLYEIFRIFGFNEAKLVGQQFCAALTTVMKETNYRQADFQRLAQLIFDGRTSITRQQFSAIFTSQRNVSDLIEDDASSVRSYNSRRENTGEYLRGFFSDWIELGYFEEKMRTLVNGRDSQGGLSNLFNEISPDKQFSELDIFHFLMEKVKAKVQTASVALLFDRLLLRQKNGRFSKNDFYLWLRNR